MGVTSVGILPHLPVRVRARIIKLILVTYMLTLLFISCL